MRRAGYLQAVGWACALALGAGACGDDKDQADEPKAAGSTPESQIASDAQVATGLEQLVQVAQDISAEQDESASKAASKGLEPLWMKVEGTVKQNEPDSYATIEEDLALLESGAPARTTTGAAELSETVDAYLAKHPG